MKLFIRQTMLLAIATSICACSSDELRELSTTKTTETPTKISLEDAVETAKSVIAQMGSSTRGNELKVESVEYIGDMTRSENDEDQACYYIVNFENESGFAILGADSRLEPVYAFSDEGNLSLSDTIENPGLKMYIDGLPKKIINTRIIIDPPTTRPQLNVNVEVKPLLTSFVRNWDQSTYNKYVRQYNNNDSKTYVGCVVVATAQILSYYRHPNIIPFNDGTGLRNYYFDWEAINEGYVGSAEQIARLFQILGSSNFLNVKYSSSATGSTSVFINEAEKTYRNLSYDTITIKPKFNQAEMSATIRSRNLVQVTGNSDDKFGHCWVIDGLANVSIPNADGIITEKKYYYHFVWGNTNSCNGYYLFNKEKNDVHSYFNDSSSAWADDEPGDKLNREYKIINSFYNFIKK